MTESRRCRERYGIVAQIFHWSMGVLILCQFAIGRFAGSLEPGIERLIWLSRHKSLGLTILVLMLVRLLWRWAAPPPPLPDQMPIWEQRVAHLAHSSIYLLVVVSALVGWLAASARGLSVNWFGVFLVPDVVDKNRFLGDVLSGAHQALVYALAALLIAHIAAGLQHALIRRDGVISRMLPEFLDKRK